MGRESLIKCWVFILFGMLACADNTTEPSIVLSPAEGSMAGYFTVTLHVSQPMQAIGVSFEEVREVFLGDVQGIALNVQSPDVLQFVNQGHPTSGPVDLELRTIAGDTSILEDVFRFNPPHVAELVSIGAIGASLTQGIQRGVPTDHSVRNGPAALLARQLGVYFPVPLLIPNAFQEMGVDDMGPEPYCDPPALDTFQQDQAIGLIELMTTDTGRFDYALGRLTPSVSTQNFAVGGTRVRELIEGPPPGDLALNFLAHLVYQPTGTITDPVSLSQGQKLEALSPKLVVCFDCLGNDLIEGMINADPFDLSERTSDEDLAQAIEDLVNRLASLDAQVLLANLPKPNVLPFFQTKRLRLEETGMQANASEYLAELEAASVLANEALERSAARHDNVHVVDIAALADGWLSDGITVGTESLAIAPFGGLVGLDGLHFTDVGYGLLANAFIEQINALLNTDVALIDIESLRSTDRERSDVLESQGLNVERCRSAN